MLDVIEASQKVKVLRGPVEIGETPQYPIVATISAISITAIMHHPHHYHPLVNSNISTSSNVDERAHLEQVVSVADRWVTNRKLSTDSAKAHRTIQIIP